MLNLLMPAGSAWSASRTINAEDGPSLVVAPGRTITANVVALDQEIIYNRLVWAMRLQMVRRARRAEQVSCRPMLSDNPCLLGEAFVAEGDEWV